MAPKPKTESNQECEKRAKYGHQPPKDSAATLIATTVAIILLMLLTVSVVGLVKAHSREATLTSRLRLLQEAAKDEAEKTLQYAGLATNGALFQTPKDEAGKRKEEKLTFKELLERAKMRCLRYAIQQGHLSVIEHLMAEKSPLFLKEDVMPEETDTDEIFYDQSLTNTGSLLDLASVSDQPDSALYVLHLASILHKKLSTENTLKSRKELKSLLMTLIGKVTHEADLLNIDIPNADCHTPLQVAAKGGEGQMLVLLARGRGSLAKSKTFDKFAVIFENITDSSTHPAVQQFTKPPEVDPYSISPVQIRNLQIQWQAPDIHRTDNFGHSALHLATGSGYYEAVHSLLSMGANANPMLVKRTATDEESTDSNIKCQKSLPPYIGPLHIAAQMKDEMGGEEFDLDSVPAKITKLLIEKGLANMLQPDADFGVTPLSSAIQHEAIVPLTVMLTQLSNNKTFVTPASPNTFNKLQLLFLTSDEYGATLFNRAFVSGNVAIMKTILEIVFPTYDPSTAPLRARAINHPDGKGWSSLHTAPFIKKDTDKMIRLLLTDKSHCAKGEKNCKTVNINIERIPVDDDPSFAGVVTPLDMAFDAGSKEVAEILKHFGGLTGEELKNRQKESRSAPRKVDEL